MASQWCPGPDIEFTVEANPETVTAELAATLAQGGVNRVSLGAQSFNPSHLQTLERWHDPANVGRSAALLREAGIANLNLDLIFAIPGQTLDDWHRDLDAALAISPEHLSCYALTYEPNTPLAQRLKLGQVERIEEEVEAAMFDTAIDRLAAAGFEQYEVSAFARPGRRCRHNLVYWTNRSWWALGPGASGHAGSIRWKNVPRLGEYLEHGPLPPVTDIERIDSRTRVGETLMLGLRLRDGVDAKNLDSLLADDPAAHERRGAIAAFERDGLLERIGGRLRLTRAGLRLADTVLAELV
jgi:oxygen-independent coproporphyrinogen-3 oxidase